MLGTRAADTRPTTWRKEDLSIEVVAETEKPTRMQIWDYDPEVCSYRSREFDEILDISGMTQDDLDAFVGCPVLDSHSTWSTMEIVGVVDEARREGTNLIVRVCLSKTEADLVSKVREGIVRKISLGYPQAGARSMKHPVTNHAVVAGSSVSMASRISKAGTVPIQSGRPPALRSLA